MSWGQTYKYLVKELFVVFELCFGSIGPILVVHILVVDEFIEERVKYIQSDESAAAVAHAEIAAAAEVFEPVHLRLRQTALRRSRICLNHGCICGRVAVDHIIQCNDAFVLV